MKKQHVPFVDARYWLAITLASVAGTNLGDLYAHELGLGIVVGLALLAVVAAVVFAVERLDARPRLAYYWLAIIIIRTGATNIADYLAFRVRVPPLLLGGGLIAVIAIGAALSRRPGSPDDVGPRPANTNAFYWIAMLGAGVFGTAVGDVCSHFMGEGYAAIALTVILAAVLLAGRRRWTEVAVYWSAVAVARTAGTAIGDFLAENRTLNIGLPASTAATTLVFLAAVAWQSRRRSASDAVDVAPVTRGGARG